MKPRKISRVCAAALVTGLLFLLIIAAPVVAITVVVLALRYMMRWALGCAGIVMTTWIERAKAKRIAGLSAKKCSITAHLQLFSSSNRE